MVGAAGVAAGVLILFVWLSLTALARAVTSLEAFAEA